MTDRPVIFSLPMVDALLDGRKHMTRRLLYSERVAKSVPPLHASALEGYPQPQIDFTRQPLGTYWTLTGWQRTKPGDRLWVREVFRYSAWDEDGDFVIEYGDKTKSRWLTPPDGDVAQGLMEKLCGELDRKGVQPNDKGLYPSAPLRWHPSIHMPRWASRLTLIVNAVRVERLHNISALDAKAEGDIERSGSPEYHQHGPHCHVLWFKQLWQRLHGHHGWNDNPWVVCVGFDVVQQNIDAGTRGMNMADLAADLEQLRQQIIGIRKRMQRRGFTRHPYRWPVRWQDEWNDLTQKAGDLQKALRWMAEGAAA